MNGPTNSSIPTSFLGRLRFPQLFVVLAVLFAISVIVPDPIPLVDELLLGVLTTMVGAWRRPSARGPAPARTTEAKPPIKNVTPPAG